MPKRATAVEWLLWAAMLVAFAAGVVMLADGGDTRASANASSFFLAAFLTGLALLRTSKRCPACRAAGLPRRPSGGVIACGACGARFRRVRRGAATWLAPAKPVALAWRGPGPDTGELIPGPPDGRWDWISAFLPRLRALRRQLRPLGARPARVLDLAKPAPVGLDLCAPPLPGDSRFDAPPAPTRRERVRRASTLAAVALALGAAAVATWHGMARLWELDAVYYVIVLFALATCALMTLVLGRALRLTDAATLALLTCDLGLKALHLAAVGRFPDTYVLGSMALLFPATPLLLGPLFRPWRVAEEAAGDFTTGRLLRSKQARSAARGGLAAAGTRRAG